MANGIWQPLHTVKYRYYSIRPSLCGGGPHCYLQYPRLQQTQPMYNTIELDTYSNIIFSHIFKYFLPYSKIDDIFSHIQKMTQETAFEDSIRSRTLSRIRIPRSEVSPLYWMRNGPFLLLWIAFEIYLISHVIDCFPSPFRKKLTIWCQGMVLSR